MSRFTYIYILQSEIDSPRFYIGHTRDLRGRLSSHNAGNVRYTRKWKPWRVKTYIAVLDPERGVALERYFKSSAGRVFIKKRL
jgi:putative endonuclease